VTKSNTSDKTTVTLAVPVKFEEQEVTEIVMDLNSLTGRDISSIKSTWAHAGNFSSVPATDMDFCALVAARASGKPIELFDVLKAKDYTKVCQTVSNFLLS
jgi:hypothetical protein